MEAIGNELLNLLILSKLQVGDKIMVYNNNIYINNGYFQGISRKWNGDSRIKSIEIIEETVNAVFKFTDDLLNRELETSNIRNKSYSARVSGNYKTTFEDEVKTQFLNINKHLNGCCNGLQNLKITYINDINTTTKLSNIIEKITMRINKIDNLMKINLHTTDISS